MAVKGTAGWNPEPRRGGAGRGPSGIQRRSLPQMDSSNVRHRPALWLWWVVSCNNSCSTVLVTPVVLPVRLYSTTQTPKANWATDLNYPTHPVGVIVIASRHVTKPSHWRLSDGRLSRVRLESQCNGAGFIRAGGVGVRGVLLQHPHTAPAKRRCISRSAIGRPGRRLFLQHFGHPNSRASLPLVPR